MRHSEVRERGGANVVDLSFSGHRCFCCESYIAAVYQAMAAQPSLSLVEVPVGCSNKNRRRETTREKGILWMMNALYPF